MGLNLLDGTTFAEKSLIEGWDSLIWTERFSSPGDFTLTTSKINETMGQLTEGNLLAVDESSTIMIIESRSIEDSDDDKAGPKLTVTGRTFETILESRACLTGESVVGFNRTAATWMLLYLQKSLETPYNAGDKINSVTSSVAALHQTLATEYWRMDQPGDILSNFSNILTTYNLGIKIVRPAVGGGVMGIVIYDGADRTSDQAVNTPVVMDVGAGHLSDASYLWSIKPWRNVAYVNAPIGFQVVYGKGVSTSVAGLGRRVLPVDASDLTDPGTDTVANALKKRGLLELGKAENMRQQTIDGSVSPISPYKFGQSYLLGDILSAKGQYGVMSDVVVTEYIRNWTSNGAFSEYPTLSLPS